MSKTPTPGTSLDITGREPANPLGTTVPTIVPPFDSSYSLVSLGSPPQVLTYYGGLTFKYDDPNTLLIGGAAGSPAGHIYQIAVTRDGNGHIVGFNGSATLYPGTGSTIGLYNDAGLVFGPNNVLFVTRYFTSHLGQLEQSKVGSMAPDKVIDLAPLGVTGSGGSIGFVPPGFPGAGSMKLVSWESGGWYHCEFAPDGNGTFNITSASLRASIISGPEGIAFVPPGSPVFSPNSVLVVLYTYAKVVTAPLDANGDPILAQSQDFIRDLFQASGACIDPVTGDFLFDTWGGSNEVFRVSGFATPPTPSPTPSPTPGPCQLRVLIAHSDFVAPSMLQSQILAEPGVTQVDFFDARVGTPTLAQLQQYQIVVPFSNDQFLDSITLGNNLADYVDGGGVVVQYGESFVGPSAGHGINGRWFNENYYSYLYSFNQVQNIPFALGTFNAGHPLMAGVSTLNSNYQNIVTLAPQATEVAAASNGNSLVAYRPINGGHTTVGVTAYIGAYATQSGDWGRVIVNAGRWLLNCQASPTPTPTVTPTATATATASATPTATATATATASVTPTATPSATVTPTVSPTPTVTPTATATATATATPTPSSTPTSSPTPSATSPPSVCVYGHGYWKNHGQWPVNQLQLGNRTYNRQELQSILQQPVQGSGLVQLAHQEIAAKLNIARGADGSCVQQTLAAVDALIGNLVIPPVGNGHLPLTPYVRTLGLYNAGGLCAPRCDLPPVPPPSPGPTARPHPTHPPRP